MAFAVLHLEKGKSVSGAIGTHIDRTVGKEFSYRHADKSRLHLNRKFKCNHSKLPLQDAIKKRLEEGYKGKRAIRKDAVTFVTHVLTGSHKEMTDLAKDKDRFEEWIQKNYGFLEKEYGKENIVRFVLHMDEKTPHIHAVTVPLTEDGRLSAREVVGNRKDLMALQDRYAENMLEFGLQRGASRTGIKHEDAKEYYSRMEKALNTPSEDLMVKKKFLGVETGIDKDKTIEAQQEHIQALSSALEAEKVRNTQEEKTKWLAEKRWKEQKNILKNLRGVATNENQREFVKGKLKEKIMKEVNTYRFEGYGKTAKERGDKFMQKAFSFMKKEGIHGSLINELQEDDAFVNAFNKYTIHPHDRLDQDRSRGMRR